MVPIAMTALNRGTFWNGQLAGEPRVPGCSSSNMKRAAAYYTEQKFIKSRWGHTSGGVAKMRGILLDTFEKLENCWTSRIFRSLRRAHGNQKDARERKASDDGRVLH